MRASQKQARGQFPRRRAGWAVYVLFIYLFRASVDRAGLVWFQNPSNAGKAHTRAKRKRACGQFPRRRAGWAVNVLSLISFSSP